MSFTIRQDGIVVTNETATPLSSGMHPYWDAHWKNLVLQFLSTSHPNVKFESKEGGFSAVFRKDNRSGRELCWNSRSLQDLKTIIPESEVDKLIADIDKFHQEAEKDSNTDGARQFVRDYRVPDPRQMRDAWRVSRGPLKKLLVLWGYHPQGAANDVVLPLTPTSGRWEDASRRVDLKEALKEAGRIGKSRLDWGWIFARVFIGLMGLLILGSLVYGLSQVDGCKTPKIGPGIGQGGGGGAGGTGPGEVGGDNGGDRSGGTDQGGTGGDGGGVGGGTGQGGLGGEKVGDNAGGSPPKPQDGEAPEDGPCGEKAGDDAGGEQPKPQDGAAPNDNQDVENPDGNADSKVPDVVIPRFSIRLESDGDNGNGTFSPVFSLISQKEMPTKANVLWELDGEKVTNEAARQTSFRPQFPDRSRHVIVADIEIPNADTQRTPQFVWSPDAPDTGKSGEDVRRFIEQIGEREDKVGTYFLFDVGSDPQDGKVSVLSWSVRKVEPKTSQRDIPPVYEGGNTNVLQVHSGDVAGNAQIEISARVVIDGKGERDIKAKRTFGVSSGDTADSLTPKESQQMMKAGERIKPSVYLVVTSTGSGTAFAVGKKYLVTNRHVAEGAKKSWFRSGKLSLYAAGSNDAISGVVKATDNVSDLALIQIDGKTDMTALALAEKVYPRQIAACVGYSVPALNAEKKSSGGYEPEVATGVLNGYNPWAKTAYSDLKAFHGNSGSPVVNEQGKVVGVVFAGTWKGTADKEIKEDLHRSCLVTLEMLKSFLNKNGVK